MSVRHFLGGNKYFITTVHTVPDVFMNKQRLVWEPSVRTNCWLIWRGLEPSPFKVAHRSAPKEEWYLGFKMKSRGSICHAWTCVSIFYQALGSTLFLRKLCQKACQMSAPSSHCPSVQFSCSVVSDFLWPHGLQHSRPPCPSPTPRAYWNSCPLSRWCHPTISSSVIPFSSHL